MIYTKLKLKTVFGNGAWDEKLCQTLLLSPGETENHVVNLHPEVEYQTWDGFGGAITEAAAYNYSLMSETQKKALMEAYFPPQRMNYQLVRIPIDSCDFSLGQYTGFERPARYIVPMLRDAEKAHGGKLAILLSPWSPPVEWKSNDTREQGGRLLPEHYGDYAEYLCEYVLWYKNQGFFVRALTLQNEPHAVQTWDSCFWTAAEQKVFLRDAMWPAMEKHGLTDIEIYLWDHNKERVYEWMHEAIDVDTDKMVAGAAVHWYSGDHFEALQLCREQFPDKKLIVSESCFEYRVYGTVAPAFAAQKLGHELIGDLNGGVSAFCDWNLLLDERGGPCYAENYCLAPFLYDPGEKKLKPQLLQQILELFSRSIVPGSVRIAHSRATEQVEATAWKRPDGTLALMLMNKSEAIAPICVRIDGMETELILYPKSVSSCILKS